MDRKLKIGLIGCGQIADAHLLELGFLKDVRVVGVCDLVEFLAQDTAERFHAEKAYTDYRKMIEEMKPDVVHITTPAQTHFSIGTDVLKAGCHAYIEKPFGIDYQEALGIIEQAKESDRIVCAGFSQWFDKVTSRLRHSLEHNDLGEVVHAESYYGNAIDGSFSKLFLQNKTHWVHKLPGKMIQNIISHPLYHLIPLLGGPVDEVSCVALDRSRNGVFNDELRIIMRSERTTGTLTITSNVKPIIQFVRVYGTRAVAEIDLANHLFSMVKSTNLPGPAARLNRAFGAARHLMGQGLGNLTDMIKGRDRYFAGLGGLFHNFYENIRNGSGKPPIPYEVVLEVSRVTNLVNEQIRERT
ncbi:MAG TPA: Gfo/Idh/MocA family oxidoreductase [Syntrophorhabdaceae bacterium]|nr:Gfo/Idh/MocA family oxidoreductase [Syntrophorhabdaceae bacterium]